MTKAIDGIAASIKAARKARALTQQDVGQRVGMPQSHISKIEKGAVDVQISTLVQIARALDLEVMLVPRKSVPSVEGTLRYFRHSSSKDIPRQIPAYRLDDDD